MSIRQEPLYPIHPSISGKRPTRIHTMDRIKLDPEQSMLLQRQALSIFTKCSNAGLPFHDCLAAILLSGIDWGVNIKGG